MYENLHITMDSFGDNCPENWEEIADYLNDRIEQATFDLDPVEDADEIRDIIDEIWNGYCERCRDGELEDNEPMPIYGDGDTESICICTINMSEGEGRQTISYNPEEGLLYSSAQEEPLDVTVGSLQEAEDACRAMWGQDCWDLRWFYWWAVDDATTKRGRCDSEKLDAQTKLEAVKEARALYTRLTPHDRRERDAFWVGYAPEDEDGYMDDNAVKVKIDIA